MPTTQQLSGLQPAPRDRGRRSTMAMCICFFCLAPLPSRQMQQAAASAASSAARPLALRQRPVQAASAAQPAAVPSLTLAINESIIAHRVLLTEAAARDGAVAIDGSPGSYHIAKAAAGSRNASKWHVHLQGGGWCWDVPSCAGRALGSKGSSDLAPNNHSIKVLPGECACAQSGYFSADPARNPTMHDWCDSAPGQDCFPKPRKQDLCVASTCPFFLLGVVICGSETSWGAGTMST